MSAVITHRAGAMEDYTPGKVPELVAELDAYVDDEHPDVSVSHDSGWTLSAFPSGLVVWENLEDDDTPRHLRDVTRAQLAELMTHCGEGHLDQLERLPWREGYG
ncbi:hypothetical protein [Verrucosispora sp. WMMC514]|uniref:hypothetical protein n=1 Tax=Verrucosispora sp. WMMC514 TaxID=3015156 RepID=UPI00248B21CD|nr:hypothetical protein [Verrucosispora sp. WMMC514]WBB89963.1 hypothetical protein O7597_23710 [Verrucosispora sp. WMMC514]